MDDHPVKAGDVERQTGESNGLNVNGNGGGGGSGSGSNSTACASITDSSTTGMVDHPGAPIPDAARGPGVEELEEDNSPPTPRFIQDEGSWKRWKWVPYPVRRFSKVAVKWARGPPTGPRRFRIEPIFPRVQHAPIWLLDRFLPRKSHRIWLLFGYLAIWIVTFALVMRQGLSVTEIEGWGTPISIGCGAAYWASGNGCGLDGMACRPFTSTGFAFRCPANCAAYQVLNPHAVGDQEVVYQPLIVGGPSDTNSTAIYRGDSFICGSAIHAGVVSNTQGGCGVVNLVGTQRNYQSSRRNGITSVGFDSYFPLSIAFEEGVDCSSRDMRWPLLAVSVVFSTFLSLFVTSPALFFFPVFTGIFWTVGLATDPPNITSVPALFSRELGNYLPAMFAAWVMYDKMGIRRTIGHGLTAQIEKTVLWLGGCWVGALTNHTFDFIPIQRLTGHDLQQQPGAQAALAIIVIVLAAIAATQVWFFQQEGRLISHLKLYGLFIVGIIICLVLPDLKLRIHHYILALLLLPGTSLQTRPSLLYQGLLVGLFINGIARWGFDPFLQTAAALRGDAQLGSPLPEILDPIIDLGQNLSTIAFKWNPPPGGVDEGYYDGLSVLVNDVERFRTYFSNDEFDADQPTNFTWTRPVNRGGSGEGGREYFRFAWMQGAQSEDYTKAGVWEADGTWVDMAPGPSRVKGRGLDLEVGGLLRRR